MSKKESTRNKNFKEVRDKLEFIQKECPETELFEDLKQLFKNKGFQNVKITHGNKEFGKDLIFSIYDEAFGEEKWFGVIVKNKNATQNDFMQGHEIGTQIELALRVPYTTTKGVEKDISALFIVINGSVSANSTTTISAFVHKVVMPHIKIWDYQELANEIEQFSKESFLDNLEPTVNTYIQEQTKVLSDISNSSNVYDLKLDDINEIFINVQTTYSKELKKINNYVSFDNKNNKFKEEDVEGSNEILNSNSNFIIHGIPTSGKTLFLRRIGIKALNTNSIKSNSVFLFDLQNFQDETLNIRNLVSSQYDKLTNGEVFELENYSKVILLFDSIDFIKSVEVRLQILTEIEEFIKSKEFPNLQVIIATRNIEFINTNNLLSEFKETELLPFNFNQALKLVKKIIPNNDQKASNFLKALKNTLLDTTLQRTPLALTLMAILYRDDKVDLKELPANIFQLYDRFTDVYLDKWDDSKGISQLYKYEQTKNILAFIAFHLHKLGLNCINDKDLKLFLTELRTKYNYDELNNIDNFILHLKSKNGVFYYDNTNNVFLFFNHFFQEYFSSLCIEDNDDEVLIDNFFNGWWSNALVFYCGKKPKSFKLHKDIINKIIPTDSFQKLLYLSQHSKCLQASHDISIENRANIVKKLVFEFDNFYKLLVTEGQQNEKSLFNHLPFVNILSQSKTLFDSTFNSKHITTIEIIELFKEILSAENELTNITIYNISYFLALHNDDAKAFELFEEKILDDIVWNRILFVDINFLKLKNEINEKMFLRIKRKMTKNQFLIQDILKNSIIQKEGTKNEIASP
jgi:NACHT domain